MFMVSTVVLREYTCLILIKIAEAAYSVLTGIYILELLEAGIDLLLLTGFVPIHVKDNYRITCFRIWPL